MAKVVRGTRASIFGIVGKFKMFFIISYHMLLLSCSQSCLIFSSRSYGLVVNVIRKIMKEYGAVEHEQVVCPDCLKHFPIKEACCWSMNNMKLSETCKNCANGHRVDTSLLCGQSCKSRVQERLTNFDDRNSVKFNDVVEGIVQIGVYSSEKRGLVKLGSGFVADKENGLIISANHTVLERENDGYWECVGDKILIGVTSRDDEEHPIAFRYLARVVAKDASVENGGLCEVDACVLKIYAKLQHDVYDGEDIDEIPQMRLSKKKLVKEDLQMLKIREDYKIEQTVRLIGFSQGGVKIVPEGSYLFQNIGCLPGTVVGRNTYNFESTEGSYSPKKEISVYCETEVGESGGPCINEQGEVIGILSRGHSTLSYLVPASEWKGMLNRAKAC